MDGGRTDYLLIQVPNNRIFKEMVQVRLWHGIEGLRAVSGSHEMVVDEDHRPKRFTEGPHDLVAAKAYTAIVVSTNLCKARTNGCAGGMNHKKKNSDHTVKSAPPPPQNAHKKTTI